MDKLGELRESIEMLEDILNYAYEGYVLVDPQGRIVKMNYDKLLGIKEEDAIGKHVEDVIENTRMHIVVKTGLKEIRDVQRIQGHDMITNRIPIIKENKIIGAVGTVLFKDISDIKELAHQLLDLQSKINKYKGEIERIEGTKYSFDNIITINPKMEYLKKVGRMAAETNSTVLITGESGTGKELFAHAIHRASYRKGEAFIAINCAAIPRDLLESELFGYDRGAFTGAKKEGKTGKFEHASGGTIFLDEIGNMPMEMQAKILRVLESKEFERIGSNKKLSFEARVIAATNENIEEAIKKGRFREDLYYRLNVITMEIPPLRDRIEDVEPLAENILDYLLHEMRLGEKEVSQEAMRYLKMYNWPGNVRELRNVLERAINLATGKTILPEHLPERLLNGMGHVIGYMEDIVPLRDVVADAEVNAIRKAIILAKGNKSLAAEKLGIHRTALYKKIDKYKISDV
ncbi:MAG: sigma 54-interacting transcriptional regulator [Tissierellaceae bacterium]|nr:sigma 54-interacting transcriptional regulator [Tissierellaceae bacterium]